MCGGGGGSQSYKRKMGDTDILIMMSGVQTPR